MPSRRSGRDTQTLSAAVMSALLPASAAVGRRGHTVRLPPQAPLIGWAWSLRSPVRR
jgi:hypothetical protein